MAEESDWGPRPGATVARVWSSHVAEPPVWEILATEQAGLLAPLESGLKRRRKGKGP